MVLSFSVSEDWREQVGLVGVLVWVCSDGVCWRGVLGVLMRCGMMGCASEMCW